ncbi:MAG: hypothetical protein KDA61_07155, partial [Planctomycetales bacterium]|nr:hypothetical protein [Planctomycetales bacterium]
DANDSIATALADLLLEQDDEQWSILEPIDLQSEGGATLTRLADGSILASGRNILGDVYSIVAHVPSAVAVVRLEAMTDESLPNGGPGRDPQYDTGNFNMTHWEIAAQRSEAAEIKLPIHKVVVEPSENSQISVRTWNVSAHKSQPNTATYLLEQPMASPQGFKLQFRMQFSNDQNWPLQNLGRFRISISADPDAFLRTQARIEALQTRDPWKRLAAAYAIAGETAALEEILQARPTVASAAGDLQRMMGRFEEAIGSYNSVITPNSLDARLVANRAAAHAGLEHWDLAKTDWLHAAELQSGFLKDEFLRYQENEQWKIASQIGLLLMERQYAERPSLGHNETLLWIQVGTVLVLAEDAKAYSDFCTRLFNEYKDEQQHFSVQRLCHACLLTPQGFDPEKLPYEKLVEFQEAGSAYEPWFEPWLYSIRALTTYRRGNPQTTLELALKSREYEGLVELGHALDLALIAMAQQQLHNHDAALAALDELSHVVERQRFDRENNQDLLTARILLREAEAMILDAQE